MKNVHAIIFTAIMCCNTVCYACISVMDSYSAGVVFNSNEGFNIERFNAIGKENVDYYESCMAIKAVVAGDIIIPNSQFFLNMADDPVNFGNVTLTNNLLTMNLSYGGGCTAHQFNLYAVQNSSETKTPHFTFYLSHNANNDDCKALISEQLTFNLRPLESLSNIVAPVKIGITVPGPDTTKSSASLLWYPNNTCSIKYRSHYSTNAMAYLDFITIPGTNQFFPRLAVIVDTSIRFISPFNYGKAVTTELTWLKGQGILTGITDEMITKIEGDFGRSHGQYWTFQDSVIAYNMWFTFGKETSGVKTSNSPVVALGGCGFNVDYKLPPETIGNTAVIESKTQFNSSKLFNAKVENGRCIIELSNEISANGYIEVIDLKGRSLTKVAIPYGHQKFAVGFSHNLSKGIYHIVYHGDGQIAVRRLVISE